MKTSILKLNLEKLAKKILLQYLLVMIYQKRIRLNFFSGNASKLSEDELAKIKSENEFLRLKVDKMSEELESLHQQLENASQRETADHQNQESEIASLKRQLEKTELILAEEKASRNEIRQHSEKLESEIELLGEKSQWPTNLFFRRTQARGRCWAATAKPKCSSSELSPSSPSWLKCKCGEFSQSCTS